MKKTHSGNETKKDEDIIKNKNEEKMYDIKWLLASKKGVMLGRSSMWESHNIGFAWQAQMQEEESSFFEWKL